MYSTNHLCRLPEEDNTTEISETISDQTKEASLCAHYHHVSILFDSTISGTFVFPVFFRLFSEIYFLN